jgi:SRSO17 transposase
MTVGQRKSIQPVAARMPDGNERNLQQFVNQSTWDPVPVRRIAERLVPQIGPDAFVIDDVSLPPRTPRMSVTVARQWCGALGKKANCRVTVAVTVHAVTDAGPVPLHWALFVPQEWDGDRVRRASATSPMRSGTARSGARRWTCWTGSPTGD